MVTDSFLAESGVEFGRQARKYAAADEPVGGKSWDSCAIS
jgi:hypothetical protein